MFRVNKTNTLFGGVKNGAFVQAKHCFLGGGAADAFGALRYSCYSKQNRFSDSENFLRKLILYI